MEQESPSLLFLLACAALVIAVSGCASAVPSVKTYPEKLGVLAEHYEKRLEEGLAGGLPFRDDGYAYAVDLSNTMRAAAVTDNRALFEGAYRMMKAHFLRTDTNDPRAQYTVLRRHKPGTTPDASGSKETGNLADALWAAYRQWGDPRHRKMALKVLDGYLKHGYWETDQRFVAKNYYNYGTQTLSENTWVLNQMPHTIRKIARCTEDSVLQRHARGMGRFVEEAYLKNGFSREMYDSGISTVISGSDGYFSPDGVYKLQSSLEIAKALLPFTESPGRSIVGFVKSEYPDVYSTYYHDPKTGDIRPLFETDDAQYAISERALTLLLATRYRNSFGEKSLRDFIGWEIVPELQKRRDQTFSTFYFEASLMVEAAHRYLNPEPLAPSEAQCPAPMDSLAIADLSVSATGEDEMRQTEMPQNKVRLGETTRKPPASKPAKNGRPDSITPARPITDAPLSLKAILSSDTTLTPGSTAVPRIAPFLSSWPIKGTSFSPPNSDRSAGGPPAGKEHMGEPSAYWSMIVGSFRDRSMAEGLAQRYRQRFEQTNMPVQLVTETAEGILRYRVAVGTFYSSEEVLQALNDYAPRLPESAWPSKIERQ